jgi:hypothetical protein
MVPPLPRTFLTTRDFGDLSRGKERSSHGNVNVGLLWAQAESPVEKLAMTAPEHK